MRELGGVNLMEPKKLARRLNEAYSSGLNVLRIEGCEQVETDGASGASREPTQKHAIVGASAMVEASPRVSARPSRQPLRPEANMASSRSIGALAISALMVAR